MGRITNTITEDEMLLITIKQTGTYTIKVRELPKKAKALVVVQTNRRISCERRKRVDPCE